MSLLLDFTLNKNAFQLTINTSIDVNDAAIHVIFGKSGCGKSHLLRAICGLENITGTIGFKQKNWQSGQHKLATHLRNVAMVFQDSQLFSHLNVQENLQFAFKRSQATQQDWQLCIEQLQLKHLLSQAIDQLSGGERQRVALARSLLSKPDLLLMDEPLASLDWSSKQSILPLIRTICKQWQLPILYVTHSIEEVLMLADNVMVLEKTNGHCQVRQYAPLIEVLQNAQSELANNTNSSILNGDAHVISPDESLGSEVIGNGLLAVTLGHQQILIPSPVHNHLQGTTLKRPTRILIHAQDVSIALSHASDSSIMNILNVNIARIEILDKQQALLHLTLDGQMLLSRISLHSLNRLELHVGMAVFAQIKGVALHQSAL